MKRLLLALLFVTPALAGPVCPSASTPCSSETVCNRGADILFCEDWEDGDHIGWAWASGWDSCTTIVGAGGYSSSNALKHHVVANACECGYPGYESLAPQSGPVYMRFYYKASPGYLFMDPDYAKMIYFRANDGNGNLQWRIELGVTARDGYREQGEMIFDALEHTPKWYYNADTVDPTNAASKYITGGVWYCIEGAIQANTPDQSDGWLKLWVDDKTYFSYTNQNLKSDGTPLNNVPWISEYYGGNPCVSHPTQDIWYDQLVVSTERIYCNSTPEGPEPGTRRVLGAN